MVTEAALAGVPTVAVVRSATSAERLRHIGAQVVQGDAQHPDHWIDQARGAAAVVDLVQPALPTRLSGRAMTAIAATRQKITEALTRSLAQLPTSDRPILVSVSGADDLQPRSDSTIDHLSPLRQQPVGFAHIGLPVRRLISASGIPAVYVYLGNLVYGPGKGFADTLVPGLLRRRIPVFGGGNRLPLVHVTDAARAIVHLAGLDHNQLVDRSYVVADPARATLAEFMRATATLLGAPAPRSAPRLIGRLAMGAIAMQTLELDAVPDTSALTATGFNFRYPSYREGLPPTLAALGHPRKGTPQS
ncbi:NAD(P)H-binding protein [Myceligenerans sp. I2]|uniref:NAD(P)H-binding protein n=1 Tax=Myceligenerans indicum TaxID=2593663 RepID=A0ABS1LSM7_9MICO|nr:NAD(P)H-binding protein [Myceligenerans indicum]